MLLPISWLSERLLDVCLGVAPHRLLHSFADLKGIKRLSLSIKQPPGTYLQSFVAALPHTIGSLDTSSLQHLSISILGLDHHRLPYLCGPDGLASISPDSLDGTLSTKLASGELERLEGVTITIQIDRSEFNQQLEAPRRLVREAVFLPSLPAQKVRVVLKPKVGEVMYDSRQPM